MFGIVFICAWTALQRTMSVWSIKIRQKKAAKIQAQRTVKMMLPDKENSFVRERLQQAMHITDIKDLPRAQTFFRFLYVQKLLVKISEQPLTTPERLEVMEINKFLGANLHQQNWSIDDVRAVNDCFARVLKLSAKYEVELPA